MTPMIHSLYMGKIVDEDLFKTAWHIIELLLYFCTSDLKVEERPTASGAAGQGSVRGAEKETRGEAGPAVRGGAPRGE